MLFIELEPIKKLLGGANTRLMYRSETGHTIECALKSTVPLQFVFIFC